MNIYGDREREILEEWLAKSMGVSRSEASKKIISSLASKTEPDLVALSVLWVSNYYKDHGCYPLFIIIKLINDDDCNARAILQRFIVECAITDYHNNLSSSCHSQFFALRHLITGQALDSSELIEVDYKLYTVSIWGYFGLITWADLGLCHHKEQAESALKEIDLTSYFYLSDFPDHERKAISNVCRALFENVSRQAVSMFYDSASGRLNASDRQNIQVMIENITFQGY